ncbi:MAG: FtsX-like permease family protein, partial [Thermoanaerobaculia bacterium]|nr:FtsX-like permease family protein [Thermoanaerobaculia bacterium]
RNVRRTALSLAVVGAGTVALLLTAGFILFSFRGLQDAIIRGGMGHLEVVRKEAVTEGAFRLDRPVSQGLEEWEELRRRITGVAGVEAAAPNLHFMGVAQAGERSASFAGVGVEPSSEEAMGFETKLRDGEGLSREAPAAGEDGVLLTVGLAESLGAEVGDWITLLGVSPGGVLNALDVRVTGLYTTGIQDLDTRLLKVHLATAQRLLQTERVSNLLVMLEGDELLPGAEERLSRALSERQPELTLVTWRERAPYYDQVRNLYLGIFYFLGSVIFVLVILSASNTLMMTVMERVREIGTLRAVGTSRAQIASIFLAESLWLGLFGGLLGGACGLLATAGINALDLKMPPPPGAVDPIDLKLALVPEAFLGAVVLMMVVLALSAAVPILKATRVEVVEALSHV